MKTGILHPTISRMWTELLEEQAHRPGNGNCLTIRSLPEQSVNMI